MKQHQQPQQQSWSCKLHKLSGDGRPQAEDLNQPITVGDVLNLHCEGQALVDRLSTLKSAQMERLKLSAPGRRSHTLDILNVNSLDENSLDLLVTSYRVGSHDLQGLELKLDGQSVVALDGVNFNVDSVLKKLMAEKPPRVSLDMRTGEPTPFGPYMPIPLQWPIWLWFAFALAGFMVLLLALWRSVMVFRKVRFRRELEAHPPSGGSAYRHFQKELRALSKRFASSDQFLQEIDQQFKWYLSRELNEPCFKQISKNIARSLQRQFPDFYQRSGGELLHLLRELERNRASARLDNFSSEDAEHLVSWMRRWSDNFQMYLLNAQSIRANNGEAMR